MVQGCIHTKQTCWTEDEFTVTVSPGIRNRDVRVAEIVVREVEKTKPDKWGYVQAHEFWSPKEERQVCPGHFWLLKFGKVAGTNSCVEQKFKGLTFEEWDPSADTDASEAPVSMIVNSSDRWFRPQRSDTTTTRGDGACSPAYAWCDSQVDSRYGYQEVCTLRG
jgi:hypothetical protein